MVKGKEQIGYVRNWGFKEEAKSIYFVRDWAAQKYSLTN